MLEWVDGDQGRASRVLDVEHASAKPRKTLIAALEQVVSGSASG